MPALFRLPSIARSIRTRKKSNPHTSSAIAIPIQFASSTKHQDGRTQGESFSSATFCVRNVVTAQPILAIIIRSALVRSFHSSEMTLFLIRVGRALCASNATTSRPLQEKVEVADTKCGCGAVLSAGKSCTSVRLLKFCAVSAVGFGVIDDLQKGLYTLEQRS